MPEQKLYTCANCGHIHSLDYCNNCGQKRHTKRFTVRQILGDFFSALLNLERGLFHTMWELTRRPAKTIGHYISGATKQYTPPFRYFLIFATINTLLIIWLGLDDQQVERTFNAMGSDEEQRHRMEIGRKMTEDFMRRYLSLIMFAIVPYLALFGRIFYWKGKHNYAEHFIIGLYAYGQQLMLGLPLSLPQYFLPKAYALSLVLSLGLTLFLLTTSYKHLEKRSWWAALWRSFFMTIFSLALFSFTVGVAGAAYSFATGDFQRMIEEEKARQQHLEDSTRAANTLDSLITLDSALRVDSAEGY